MAFDEQGTFLCDNVLYACAQATQLQAPPQADTHVVSPPPPPLLDRAKN